MKKIATLMFLVALFVLGFSATTAQDESWWAEAGKPYAGVVLHGVTESTPPSNYAKDVLAPQFEKLTGIKVELETTSWDQMYDKAIKDMEAKTGVYDFVYIEQDIIYSYLSRDFLVDMTKGLKDNPKLVAPGFSFDNFTSFLNYFKDPKKDNDVFGMPMEAFIKVYLYRTDLFNNEEIKTAFKEKYGYDLAPATTHEQYTQIAEFFTEWGKAHDMDLWGTTVQAASGHPSSFYEFLESVAPTFGVYNWGINESYKATSANGGSLDSDTAKKALEWWLGNLKYAPPESTSSTWDEVAASFAAGRAAQGLVYGENAAWIATNAEKSKVVGNVGVAIPPLSDGVLDAAKAGKGYVGYYDGGAFGIPVTSKNQEATMLWLQYIGLPEVQADWALAGSRITHNATFDDPKITDSNTKTDNYFSKMKEWGPLFAGAPPFPFHAQVREVIAPFIYKAIAGELSASDALDQAAKAADEELIKLGYAK
jgi:multiple sugar transport system substrate-binding protein